MKNFIPFTADHELAAIATGLLDCTLPKSAWTHSGHFAATLWLLAMRPDFDLYRELPPAIRAYNESTGSANTNTSGYHETITQASIRAASAFLREHRDRQLFQTCNALMESPLGDSAWLLDYWSRDRLFSVEARRGWLGPDLRELPF